MNDNICVGQGGTGYAKMDVDLNETREFEFKRLIEWASMTRFDTEISRYQLRCLWTAFCVHNDISPYDEDYVLNLEDIWNNMDKNIQVTAGDIVWSGWADFELFMREYLI